ncbi:hypothetical protein [Conexibacter sp. DBS9H8]|uniref:hypothetical protein n=1 Tax=Conexibacter sp. DBS9H8 TaxID=2937801 RepID=UPI00200D7929|nr:hypothetical protein [Conexibacter sp. DBS9H8]
MPDSAPVVAPLADVPSVEQWDSWTEYDPAAWPKKVKRADMLGPTVCVNCESACGLTAYVEKETVEIKTLEGNPHNSGSRRRNCAKGTARINQSHDREWILHWRPPRGGIAGTGARASTPPAEAGGGEMGALAGSAGSRAG